MRLAQLLGPGRWPAAVVAACGVAVLWAPLADADGSSAADGETPYTVYGCDPNPETGGKVCTVDRGTYLGWRAYHAFCHVCHAQDAVGSTFAPSLLDRLKRIDKARFLESVNEGYTGQMGVMPGWKENPNVRKRYEELYAYLRARSDGALAGGRPKWKKPEE